MRHPVSLPCLRGCEETPRCSGRGSPSPDVLKLLFFSTEEADPPQGILWGGSVLAESLCLGTELVAGSVPAAAKIGFPPRCVCLMPGWGFGDVGRGRCARVPAGGTAHPASQPRRGCWDTRGTGDWGCRGPCPVPAVTSALAAPGCAVGAALGFTAARPLSPCRAAASVGEEEMMRCPDAFLLLLLLLLLGVKKQWRGCQGGQRGDVQAQQRGLG